MPRFPESWKPADDSTPGLVQPDVDRVVLSVPRRDGRSACPCGCGEWPTGKNAIFRMGHDARLRGILIRAHLAGVKVQEVDGTDESLHLWLPIDIAARHGWQDSLVTAVTRREGKNREVLRRALDASDKNIRVGRWAYTGGQVAAVYSTRKPDKHLLEYVTRWGERKTMYIPAAEVEEVMNDAL